VSERNPGFFVQIKPPAWRAYAPEGKTIPLRREVKKTVFIQTLFKVGAMIGSHPNDVKGLGG